MCLMFVLTILGKEMPLTCGSSVTCDPSFIIHFLCILIEMSQLALKSNPERIQCEQMT